MRVSLARSKKELTADATNEAYKQWAVPTQVAISSLPIILSGKV